MQNTPFAQQQRQVNAFLEKTRQLGAQMDRDQGTTRIIYDTSGNVNTRSTFDFFNEVASKVFPATNLENNRFQPGEGMVIKELYIYDLTQRTNFQRTGMMFSVLDFNVGNNRILKSLPLTTFSTIAALNPLNSTSLSAVTLGNTYTVIRLRTNIIIPPLVQFTAQLRTPAPLGTVEAPVNIKLAIKGYGKLFNPNANY